MELLDDNWPGLGIDDERSARLDQLQNEQQTQGDRNDQNARDGSPQNRAQAVTAQKIAFVEQSVERMVVGQIQGKSDRNEAIPDSNFPRSADSFQRIGLSPKYEHPTKEHRRKRSSGKIAVFKQDKRQEHTRNRIR